MKQTEITVHRYLDRLSYLRAISTLANCWGGVAPEDSRVRLLDFVMWR